MGLYLVCLRMNAWYLTELMSDSALICRKFLEALNEEQRHMASGTTSECLCEQCMAKLCIPSHVAVCSALLRDASIDRGERTLRAEELAGDVQGLASHNDDLLAVEQLLSDRGGQATEKVPLSVDDLRGVLAGPVLTLRECSSNL